MVISGAAFGRSDVRGLVYTAAFVPNNIRAQQGDSITSLGVGFLQSEAFDQLNLHGGAVRHKGEWDEAMAVVQRAVAVTAHAPRVSLSLKADLRPG